MRRRDPLLLAIVAAALGLRLVGLGWGLPNAERYHPYHPDEILQVGATLAVDPIGGRFDPGFYNYGSLSFFLTRIAWEITEGLAPSGTEPWAVAARVDLVGRFLVALFGALTVLLTFDIGRRLMQGGKASSGPVPGVVDAPEPGGAPEGRAGVFRRAARGVLLGSAARGMPSAAGGVYWRSALGSRVAGLCAAAMLAAAPEHLAHSHYFTVDVPAAFWTAASLAAALRILDAHRLRYAVIAGACAGLAAATKYNAGLVLLAPLAALALSCRGRSAGAESLSATPGEEAAAPAAPSRVTFWRCFVPQTVACVAVAAAAFLAGCPGVFLNTPLFLQNFLYEAQKSQVGQGILFERTLPAWIYHVVMSLRFGLGIPLLVVTLLAVARAARRRSRADLVLAAWALPYYLVIGVAQVKFQRYTIPLLPVLAAWFGALCAEWLLDTRRARWRPLLASGLVGVGFWTLGSAISYDILFSSPDPRDRAAAEVHSALRPGATVALTAVPWFYTPPLVPWNGGGKTQASFEQARPKWPYHFLAGGWTAQRLARERPECFVVSDLDEQIRDGLRLGIPQARDLIATLERDYHKEEFGPVATWPGMLGPGCAPIDWIYPAPTITLYLRDARPE